MALTRLQPVFRRAAKGLALAVCGIAGMLALLDQADKAWPPPMAREQLRSREVLDRNGEPLRLFANEQGRWRLQASLGRIDRQFVEMLIGYEDKRFHSHKGVDPLAIARATAQFVRNGHIVSGGSTITMQLARLLEPRQSRSLAAKLRQCLRALQIERRLSKDEILELYLTLAPYGGNLEGVRAASLVWFGKEPKKLTTAQAALLVALPQSPEARRPDKHNDTARLARARVIERLIRAGMIDRQELERVARQPVPSVRLAMPNLSPHLAEIAVNRDPRAMQHKTTLDGELQARLEAVVRDGARRNGERVSVALIAADTANGEILARIGSPDYLDGTRLGWIDMTKALRSPGSTLKPFIYGLAIEDGLVLPETLISDRQGDFSGYKPANFDMTYQGDVSVREALQKSLNVPAIRLLDRLGPTRLVARLRRAGVSLVFPQGERPGLSLGLGGAGLTLQDLVQLYANLSSTGKDPVALGDGVTTMPGQIGGAPMLSKVATWHIGDILAGIANPSGTRAARIAWKTGTSYGYRDAWAIGYDGRHVIGIWVGRADNGAVPGITGANTAGPILFEAFERAGFEAAPLQKAPAGAVRISQDQLPAPLLRFGDAAQRPASARQYAGQALHIAFPAAGSQLEIQAPGSAESAPVVLKLQGGTPPFRLLANGRPNGEASRTRQLQWLPDGLGFARLTVIDVAGQAQSVEVQLRAPGY